MSVVIITCRLDSSHTSIPLDLNEEEDRSIFTSLYRKGWKCRICEGDLYTVQKSGGFVEHSGDRVAQSNQEDIQSRMLIGSDNEPQDALRGTVRINQEDLGDFVVSDYYERREGIVSSHISQLLPLKAACDILAEYLLERKKKTDGNKFVSEKELKEKLLPRLSELRLGLIEAENRTGVTRRGYRPSAGLPIHRDEEMPQMYATGALRRNREKKVLESRKDIETNSQKRFLVTVFGGLTGKRSGRERVPHGALFQLGLGAIRESSEGNFEVALTEMGADLAALTNSLIQRNDLATITKKDLLERFSEDETRWWWKYIHSSKSVEMDSITTVINLLEDNLVTKKVDDIALYLAENVEHVKMLSKRSGNPPPMKAYTSSLVNRWTSLGIIDRFSPGTYMIGPRFNPKEAVPFKRPSRLPTSKQKREFFSRKKE